MLADTHDIDELGGAGVEVDHVAGLLGSLGARVHGHGDIRLRQRRRVVGAVAGHRDQMALMLERADLLELALGGGLGQEVVNAGLGGDCRGGERVVARHHDGLDAHLAQVGELLLNAGLDDVLEVHNAQHAAILGHDQRGAAGLGDALDGLVALLGEHAAGCLHIGAHGIGSALADLIALVVHTGHAGRRGEGDELHTLILECAAAQTELLLGEHDDGTAFGGLVGQRGKLGGIGQLRGIDAVDRDELGGLTVTQGDGAGLVEHEDVDVAGGLDGAAGHGQHVGLVQTAHEPGTRAAPRAWSRPWGCPCR